MHRTGLEEREHDDDEVRVLPKERQPRPFEPYGLNAPARGQGQGLSRRSPTGDRWCPFCQTPCSGSGSRAGAVIRFDLRTCSRAGCKPSHRRRRAKSRWMNWEILSPSLTRCRASSASHPPTRTGRGLSGAQVEDIFMACKDVMVASDAIRRTRRTAD
jgi:hypothetical protein